MTSQIKFYFGATQQFSKAPATAKSKAPGLQDSGQAVRGRYTCTHSALLQQMEILTGSSFFVEEPE